MMKQIFTLIAVAVSFLFWTSCTVQKEVSKAAAPSGKYPEFIEDVTISGQTGHARSIEQDKQVYQKEKSDLNRKSKIITTEGNTLGIAVNHDLYEFIEEWYGIPYRMGGTTKKGIDCSAFVKQLYGEVYQTDIVRTSREQFATCHYVGQWTDLQEGDLVFFKIRTKEISHVGVYLGDGKFVHASRSQGVVISSLNNVYWTRYYAGGGRVSG